MLIIVAGLPGSGKTTFAEAFAESRQAIHLNSDSVRTEVGKRGQYDAASKQVVYNWLLDRVKKGLSDQKDVVVDSTFYLQKLREDFESTAEKFQVPLFIVFVEASEEAIRQRMQKSRQDSEADFQVYLDIRSAFEPISGGYLSLRSDKLSLEQMVNAAIKYFIS